MSGICAVWHESNSHWTSAAISGITRAMSLHADDVPRHRTETCAAVGVSARFANQQIWESDSVFIACDAELYNEEELGGAAAQGEHEPAGTARFIAGLYNRVGPTFVEQLTGAFSVVIWDRRAKTLVAAVDGFGIKRLALYRGRGCVVLSSRVDSISSSGAADLTINPRAIANVLNFSADLAPDTIFKEVERLAPGSILTVRDGCTRIRSYWDMHYSAGAAAHVRQLGAELESVFQRSVATHCKGDSFTELGAFLSGGTDSSTVVGMMSRMGRGAVKAFSIGFREQPFNELGYAELAAKAFSAHHYTYMVGADDCFEALPQIVRYFDEPYGNSSAIPTYFCARLAADNGVKTLLAGDGGDELFGGNERYRTDMMFEMYHSIPGLLRTGLIEPVVASLPFRNGLTRRARGYIRRANTPGVRRMLSFQFLATHSPEEVFDSDFAAALQPYSVFDTPSGHYAAASASHHLDRLLYVDMKITLADNDLPKVTAMSELAGIQVRFPYLHRPVAELSGRIPAGLKVRGLEKRYLFKRAFRNLLPTEIIHKQKHGFGIPVAIWVKTDRNLRELTGDTLLSRRTFERGYFRREFVEELFRKHRDTDSTYYGDTIWTVLMLELWHRQVADAAVARAAV
jgi:asparagine synthase (glutamine-hydrolysing)